MSSRLPQHPFVLLAAASAINVPARVASSARRLTLHLPRSWPWGQSSDPWPPDPCRPRLGDVVVACHGDIAILSTTDFPYEATLVGLRGSLTPGGELVRW